MDYQKLDAALAAAFVNAGKADKAMFEVFIYVDGKLGEAEQAVLEAMGIHTQGTEKIITARLAARSIEELSHLPWVSQIKLSQRLRPAEGSEP